MSGYCEVCGEKIERYSWMTQHAAICGGDPLCAVCWHAACPGCAEVERYHDRLDAKGSLPDFDGTERRPGVIAGKVPKRRSRSDVLVAALCATPLTCAVVGFGYIVIHDILPGIGVLR